MGVESHQSAWGIQNHLIKSKCQSWASYVLFLGHLDSEKRG